MMQFARVKHSTWLTCHILLYTYQETQETVLWPALCTVHDVAVAPWGADVL